MGYLIDQMAATGFFDWYDQHPVLFSIMAFSLYFLILLWWILDRKYPDRKKSRKSKR